MRGISETTRGASLPPGESRVVKRNATPSDLEREREKYLGQLVTWPNQPHLHFTCVNVRLDSLNRLIFDLVKQGRQREETDATDK